MHIEYELRFSHEVLHFSQSMKEEHSSGHGLGWFLCWAVVFADIGTSLYYVPGILFGEVGNLAGLFVLMSSVVFVLLTLKYIEITDRYAEGGGVVTVATHAFGSWFGALGGMFITVDYFLTAAISSVSGFAYLNSIVNISQFIVPFSLLGIAFLGVLNIIGIKESAKVTAVVATAACIVDLVLVALIASQVRPEGWQIVFGSLSQISRLGAWPLLTGFAGSFLAFSGLESISQLSPAMKTPRKKVASISMGFVVLAILITSPLLTLFSTNLLTAKAEGTSETILESVSNVKAREVALKNTTDPKEKAALEEEIQRGSEYSERFISELGAQYGGSFLKIAVVATASILLLFASNTAIIGSYHVFIALSRQHFLPEILQTHNVRFGSPHWAVLLAVAPPLLIVLLTNGNVALLGQLYAFGLLGAFGLSSLGLDVVRWKEGQRFNLNFVIGVLTTISVLIAWGVNLYNKQLATIFGGAITVVGMAIAYVVYQQYRKMHSAETESAAVNLQVAKVSELNKGQILVPVYGEFDTGLFAYVGKYAKHEQKSVVVAYIREFSDVYQSVSESLQQDEEAQALLQNAVEVLRDFHVDVSVLYKADSDAALVINRYRKRLKPSLTIVSPHQQSLMMDFLHGNFLKDVIAQRNGNVLIYTGEHDETPTQHPASYAAVA
jgi:amino acid transporter